MYEFLTHRQAPLPFQGQKRNFVVRFAHEISRLPDDTVFVDLFGGSGLLSRAAKDVKPGSRVVYNDFDNYHTRIEAIPRTNVLLDELRPVFAEVPKEKILPDVLRNKALEIIERHDNAGFVDYITLSSSVLFSMQYANSLAELRKKSLYNNFKRGNYDENDQYLKGLEVRSCDYRLLFDEFKDNPNVFFICDPPYLSTDATAYKAYWKLRDYLDVLKCLQASRFVYFTSDKSSLVELFEWLENEYGALNPFAGAKVFKIETRMNYNATYNDIMIFKE